MSPDQNSNPQDPSRTLKIERFEAGPRGRTFPNAIIECREWLVGEFRKRYDFNIEVDNRSFTGETASWETLLPAALKRLQTVDGFTDVPEIDAVKL